MSRNPREPLPQPSHLAPPSQPLLSSQPMISSAQHPAPPQLDPSSAIAPYPRRSPAHHPHQQPTEYSLFDAIAAQQSGPQLPFPDTTVDLHHLYSATSTPHSHSHPPPPPPPPSSAMHHPPQHPAPAVSSQPPTFLYPPPPQQSSHPQHPHDNPRTTQWSRPTHVHPSQHHTFRPSAPFTDQPPPTYPSSQQHPPPFYTDLPDRDSVAAASAHHPKREDSASRAMPMRLPSNSISPSVPRTDDRAVSVDTRKGKERVQRKCPHCGAMNHIRKNKCKVCDAPKEPAKKRSKRSRRKKVVPAQDVGAGGSAAGRAVEGVLGRIPMEQTRGMLMMHPIGGGGGGGGAQIGDDSVQLPQMVGAPRHDLGYEPTSQDACRGYHHQTDPRG